MLTIGRARPPFGYAPPAGHVDQRTSFEQAANEELFEEVGLRCSRLELLIEGRLNNHCRRADGDWHYWKIYRADGVQGDVLPSAEEVKDVAWLDKSELASMASRTLKGDQSERLEPAWAYWLTKLGIIELSPEDLMTVVRLI